MTSHKRNLPVVMIFALFLIPLLLSWIFYHYNQLFHFKTTNHGILLAQPIEADFLYKSSPTAAQRKWRIIYVNAKKDCDSTCQRQLYFLQQIPKALGKDGSRVLVIKIKANNESLRELKTRLASVHAALSDVKDKIYLADPGHRIFIYYPANADPMNILKDLKHVLEVSQIG